jgi:hypothetical protein
MDFDSLPEDEKIVCLCSIFPETDPSLLYELLQTYKVADALFPAILQITDPDYKNADNRSSHTYSEPAVLSPQREDNPPNIISTHLQPTAPPIGEQMTTIYPSMSDISSRESSGSNKITEITTKVKNFVSSKFRSSPKPQYQPIYNQEWMDWDEEHDDPENQMIVFDRNVEDEKLRRRKK